MPSVTQPIATDLFGTRTQTSYFARQQQVDSLYAEADIPLIAQRRFPFVHELAAQVSGRVERFTVDAGTQGAMNYVDYDFIDYIGPTRDGQPFTDTDSYRSVDRTFGLKYRPVRQVLVRASLATGFLPPIPADLMLVPDSEATSSIRAALHRPRAPAAFLPAACCTVR
jgi:hypothetical protein